MNIGSGKKVLLAMSGGVDSSVAAVLLLKQGYSVVGCFMRLGSEDSVESPEDEIEAACDPAKKKAGHQGCCSVNDAADARLVAAMLDIPFYVLNFRKDFARIMEYFVAEYNAGRTPNPCVRCNDWLKFGKLWDYARTIGADYVATGHYARVDRSDPAETKLLRGSDYRKDQSYVLFGTKRENLGHMLLPIGDMEKPDVRAIAAEWNLPVFDKPDSQEICFVPDNDYARFVKHRAPEQVQPGQILDEKGNVVGTHPGQQHFTIGQRRGLGVAIGLPQYVTQRDSQKNTITVGPKESLLSHGLEADQTNWLIDVPEMGVEKKCLVKIRYNSPPVDATMLVPGPDLLQVKFAEAQSAVTPGQAVVCYDGDRLIGGGWITKAV